MRRHGALRRITVGVVVLGIVASAVVATGTPPAAGAVGVDDAVREILPPNARQLLAVVSIVKGLSARNEVYREARDVQDDIRAYYDARIEKAKELAAGRTQLGLRESQIAAYMRVATTLRAERDAALALTEDEKRAAKYTFEGRLRAEIFGAISRTSKGQEALRDVRDTLSEVKGNFEKLQAAIEGQNPITGFVEDVQKQVDRVRTAGQILTVIGGSAGTALIAKADALQGVIDDMTAGTEQAAAASGEAIGTIDEAIEALDGHIDTRRTPRAATDMLIGQAAEAAAERIFAPSGEAPAEDVAADVIAAGANAALVNNVAVAVGAIEPSELATMRERVRAQLLQDKLATISRQCGRLTGALHTATVETLTSGDDPPETTPCALFRNPEALADFIRRMREGRDTDDTTTTTSTPTTVGTVPEDDTIEGTYTGEVTLGAPFPDFAILDSLVEITVTAEGGLDVTIAYTMASPFRYVDEDVVCRGAIRYLYEGHGSAGSDTVKVDLSLVGYEIPSIEGSGCGVDRNWDVPVEEDIEHDFIIRTETLTGAIQDGVVNASFAEGFLVVAATRR